MVLKNYLGILDYFVIAFCLLFSLFIGVYYATRGRKKSNNDELLVGSRNMGALPVAASILVSYLSAITILGYPAEVYTYGSQVFLMQFLGIFTTPIGIFLFVRIMYDLKLTSAYKYLELRYDSIVVRWVGSLIFIIQLLFISGIVMYAPSIMMETMMGVPLWISVILIAVVGTIYTSIGGIKAVVWTDVFQFFMIFIGMTAIVVKGVYSSGGFYNMFDIAYKGGRLELFNWSIDPFMRHNTLNIILGSGFSGCLFLTHQPVLQRYCGLPSFRDAVKSIVISYILGFFTLSLVIVTGIAVYSHYADCDPVKSMQIDKSDQIVPFFVIQELAFIPGMMGLFAAVVFSAVLSTISSTLNSLAAVTWEDFLSKISVFKNMGDFGQACTYKILTIFYGILCVALAFGAEHFGSVLQAAITVVGAAIGILGAVFLMGVFMPFVNKTGAISGLIVGIMTTTFLTVQALILQKKYSFQPKLDVSIEVCPESVYQSLINVTSSKPLLPADELMYPEKLFTVSYILYSLIGGVVTIVVAILVSVCTGGCQSAKYVSPEFLHPLIRPKKGPKEPTFTIPKAHINHAFDHESSGQQLEMGHVPTFKNCNCN